MKKKAKVRAEGQDEPKSLAPLKVTVSITENGDVTVDPDCLVVTGGKRKICWILDDASKKSWRLSGFCWCGTTEPPGGEFHDWNKKKAKITVTDRNDMGGEWRYGLLYKEKGKGADSQPRVFDPTIRNQPPR